MDLGYLPPLPMGLISAAARDLALRATRFAGVAARRQAAAVLGVAAVAALINAADWRHGDVRFLVAMSLGSLVATTALAVGWASEPAAIEKWTVWALCASVASAIPLISL